MQRNNHVLNKGCALQSIMTYYQPTSPSLVLNGGRLPCRWIFFSVGGRNPEPLKMIQTLLTSIDSISLHFGVIIDLHHDILAATNDLSSTEVETAGATERFGRGSVRSLLLYAGHQQQRLRDLEPLGVQITE